MRVSLLLFGLSLGACYDVDALRAGREEPIDAGGDPSDAADAADAADVRDAPVESTGDGGRICPPTTPSDSLVGYYPLDEVAGLSVPDCSSKPLDGVVIGGSPAWTPARNGGGLRLSSTAGCVQLGSAASASALDFTGAFSVTTWLKVVSFPGTESGYIAGKTRDPDTGGWRIGTEGGGKVGGAIALPTMVRLPVSAVIAPNTWVHVALVAVPGGDLTLYVGGEVGDKKAGVPSPLIPDKLASARIGCRSDGTQELDGVVDDVHFYARALSQAEVRALAK